MWSYSLSEFGVLGGVTSYVWSHVRRLLHHNVTQNGLKLGRTWLLERVARVIELWWCGCLVSAPSVSYGQLPYDKTHHTEIG